MYCQIVVKEHERPHKAWAINYFPVGTILNAWSRDGWFEIYAKDNPKWKKSFNHAADPKRLIAGPHQVRLVTPLDIIRKRLESI